MGYCNWCGIYCIGDLDCGQVDVVVGSGDDDEIFGGQLCLFQQCVLCGDVLYLYCSCCFEVQCLWVFDCQLCWYVGQFVVGVLVGDIQWWYYVYCIVSSEFVYGIVDCFDYVGCFIVQLVGEWCFLQVGVVVEYYFGMVQVDGFDLDLDFVGSGGGNVDIVDVQYIGVVIFVDVDNLVYGGF